MVAINGEVGDLEKVLNSLKGYITFVDIDIPEENFKEIKNYDRTTRGKVLNLTIKLKRAHHRTIVIDIKDSNEIPKELKEFLETNSLVTFGLIFDVKILLNYDVKINIVHDIRCLMHVITGENMDFDSVKKLENMVKASRLGVMETLYFKYKAYLIDENYLNLVKMTKLAALTSYFGIHTDLDKNVVDKNVAEVQANIDELVNKFTCEYDVDVTDRFSIFRYIKNVLGIKDRINLSSEKALLKMSYLHPECKDFFNLLINYHKLSHDLRYLNKEWNTFIRITNKFEFRCNFSSLSYFLPVNYLDIFRTNSKKHYYISIDSKYIFYSYLEKVCNNFILDDSLDYHTYIASKLYDKDEELITKEERINAKRYNFFRLCNIDKDFFKFSSSTFLYDLQKSISSIPNKDKVPLFVKESLSDFYELIMRKIANLHDVLDSLDDYSITLVNRDYDAFVFKVSNKVNPYRAMKIVADALDTSKEIGLRLFSIFSIGNSLKELYEFDNIKNDKGYYVSRLTYIDVIDKFNSISNEKLRNIVETVKNDFKVD